MAEDSLNSYLLRLYGEWLVFKANPQSMSATTDGPDDVDGGEEESETETETEELPNKDGDKPPEEDDIEEQSGEDEPQIGSGVSATNNLAALGKNHKNIIDNRKKESNARRSARERKEQALELPSAFVAGNMLKFVRDDVKIRIDPSKGWMLAPKTVFPKSKPIRAKIPLESRSFVVGRLSDDVGVLKKRHSKDQETWHYQRGAEEVRMLLQAGHHGYSYKDAFGVQVRDDAIVYSYQYRTLEQRTKELDVITLYFNTEMARIGRKYKEDMRAWRTDVRNWESGVLTREWKRGNFAIFREGTTHEMINAAKDQLFADNEDEVAGKFKDEYCGRIPPIIFKDQPYYSADSSNTSADEEDPQDDEPPPKRTKETVPRTRKRNSAPGLTEEQKAEKKTEKKAQKDAEKEAKKAKNDAEKEAFKEYRQKLNQLKKDGARERKNQLAQELSDEVERATREHVLRMGLTTEWRKMDEKDRKTHLSNYGKFYRAGLKTNVEFELPEGLKTPEPNSDLVHRRHRAKAVELYKEHADRCSLNSNWNNLKPEDKKRAFESWVHLATEGLKSGSFDPKTDIQDDLRTPTPDPVQPENDRPTNKSSDT